MQHLEKPSLVEHRLVDAEGFHHRQGHGGIERAQIGHVTVEEVRVIDENRTLLKADGGIEKDSSICGISARF